MSNPNLKNPFSFWLEFFEKEILEKRKHFGEQDLPQFNIDFWTELPSLIKNGLASSSNDLLIIKAELYKTRAHPAEENPKCDLVFHFDDHLRDILKEDIKRTKELIADNFNAISINGGSSSNYFNFLYRLINKLENHPNNKFIFTKTLIDEFKKTVELYSPSQKEERSILSFELIKNGSAFTVSSLEGFYKLLTKRGLIESSKEEFINAFSNQEVSEGIRWLVKGKNGQSSKTSLFYFLDELMNEGFLSKSIISDLNLRVKYVFRDSNGIMFKNLRQSKATLSNNPAGKENIDLVISSIS